MSIQELPLQAQSNLIVTTHEITRIINTHVPMLYARNLFFAPPFIVHGNTAVSIESGRIVTRLPLGTIDTVTPYMDTAMGACARGVVVLLLGPDVWSKVVQHLRTLYVFSGNHRKVIV